MNAFLLVLLVLAVSSPAIQSQSEQKTQKHITYLNDQSRSMVGLNRNITMEGVSINQKILASRNNSNLDRALLTLLEPNTTYLVNTDLQGVEDLEKVAENYNEKNSTLNFLEADQPTEASVAIEGPELTVPEANNRYSLQVSTTDDQPRDVKIFIDGELRFTESVQGEKSFTEVFEEKGIHRIEARIEADDRYKQNNRFYKTVNVVDKPEVLVVGEEGQLEEKLSEFYELTKRDEIPSDLSKFYSVILKEKLKDTKSLKPYLADGNGLMYAGKGSMDILPVKEKDYSTSTSTPKIVIGIDKSRGFVKNSEGFSKKCVIGDSIKESKKIGSTLISNLADYRPGTATGAFAYNETVFSFGEPKPLSNSDYTNKLLGAGGSGGILSIPVCGSAYHIKAIESSLEMMDGSPGNIILITDGKVPPNKGIFFEELKSGEKLKATEDDYRERAIELASEIPDEVSLHTVAVGKDPKEGFLQELSEEGNGVSVGKSDNLEKLTKNIQGGGGSNIKGISILDSNHFITEKFGMLRSSTSNFEEVAAKDSARELIRSSHGRPVLTTWRYGLGRVASFSAGGRNLESFISQDPAIVSRTMSWTVGEPQRKENSIIDVESGRGESPTVVSSDRKIEGLSRKSENMYQAKFRPERTGFHRFQDLVFAHNYPKEIENIGFRSEEIESLAESTGGKVYREEGLANLGSEVKAQRSEVVGTRSLSGYLVLVALLFFLSQVGYRKMNGLL